MTVSENSVLDTEVLKGGSAMPHERPGAMEPQSLSQMPPGFPRRSTVANGVRSLAMRRFWVVGGALLLSLFAIYEMCSVFSIGGITPLEYLMLALFAINFCWIALAFCSGIAGFVLLLKKPKAKELESSPLHTRTAILMPTYNES
ncbi:MAG: glucans biosynthesis glucosyltransferase MdoH, partial [Shewanella sp.]